MRVIVRIIGQIAVALSVTFALASLAVPAHAASQNVSSDQTDAQARQMLEELNRINPFIQHSPLPAGSVPAAASPSFDVLKGVLENPWVQKYLHILSDQNLQHDALAVINSPERVSFFLCELGWIIFMLVFKVWRMVKAKRFWSMLWTQFWTLSLFLAGIFYVVPRLVLGPVYSQFLHSLIHAI